MTLYRVVSDDHSNHNLPIGALVVKLDESRIPDWDDGSVTWYTQGGDDDEVAIDPADLVVADSVDDTFTSCTHCERTIVRENGRWIDPNAGLDSDDSMWRETCDSHDTFTAEHEPEFTVEGVDWHRNGIAGSGFYVGIVNDAETGRMLVIDFGSDDAEANEHSTCVAVLNLDMAAAGNIYMHPRTDVEKSGGNAWRGDMLGDKYIPALRAEQDKRWKI